MTNLATAHANGTDSNESQATVTADLVADLAVTKTDGSLTYTPGMPVTYTITVTNSGPSDAIGAIVTDALPPGSRAPPGPRSGPRARPSPRPARAG